MAMETRIVTVTPEMATLWLERNKNNRNVLHERVKEYAQDMLTGKWRLTHQGIAFDETGELLDGQHRLMAVEMAGVPVQMNVTTGVEHKDGEVLEIDTGRVRTYKNIMQMAGVNDPVYTTMSAVIMLFLRLKMSAVRVHAQHHVVSDYIQRHYDEVSFIADAFGYTSRGKKHAPAIIAAAALSALYGHENRDAISKFGQVYVQNDTSCSRYYNVKVALDCKDKMRNLRSSPETFAYVENCIRCFANNLHVVRIIDCYKLDKASVL